LCALIFCFTATNYFRLLFFALFDEVFAFFTVTVAGTGTGVPAGTDTTAYASLKLTGFSAFARKRKFSISTKIEKPIAK
jgi:hypothetical protein